VHASGSQSKGGVTLRTVGLVEHFLLLAVPARQLVDLGVRIQTAREKRTTQSRRAKALKGGTLRLMTASVYGFDSTTQVHTLFFTNVIRRSMTITFSLRQVCVLAHWSSWEVVTGQALPGSITATRPSVILLGSYPAGGGCEASGGTRENIEVRKEDFAGIHLYLRGINGFDSCGRCPSDSVMHTQKLHHIAGP
jgi:hypothetical protein